MRLSHAPDWPALLRDFPVLGDLATTAQEPEWHAEGDVLSHTRMVCAALEGMPAFQALAAREQEILRWAAVFHDVGKPATTKLGDDNKLHAYGHSRIGAQILRELWWREGSLLDAAYRAEVLSLVRYHAAPLHGEDRLEDYVAGHSVVVNCQRVAILAEADMRGRVCPAAEMEQALFKIEMFRLTAQELGCFETPYPWHNDHSRWLFFQRGMRDRHYDAFDDRKFTVHMTVGLPASGKSTWAQSTKLPIVNRDLIREEFNLEPGKRKDEGRTTQHFTEQLRVHLREQTPVVVDGTHLLATLRGNVIEICANYGARVVVHYFDVERRTVVARNHERPAAVPTDILDRMGRKLEPPTLMEAHDVELHES